MRTIKNELRETKIKKFNQNREDKDNNRVYTWLDPNHQPQPRRRQHRDYPPRRYDVQETGTSDQHSTDSASSGPIDFLYQRLRGSGRSRGGRGYPGPGTRRGHHARQRRNESAEGIRDQRDNYHLRPRSEARTERYPRRR